MPVCEYCNKNLYDKSTLNKHQKESKSCIKIRLQKYPNLAIEKIEFKCKYCEKKLSCKRRLETHINICKKKNEKKIDTNEITEMKVEIKTLKKEIERVKANTVYSLNNTLTDAHLKIDKLQKMLCDIASKDVNKPTNIIYNEEINDNEKSSDEVDNEKSADEIDNEYKRQITTLKTTLDTNKEQYQKLLNKHNSSLKTHRYIKFKKTDPCFYIIDSGIDCDCLRYKFGITGLDQGNNIDDRLRCHRTLWPQLKVRYLLFIKDVEVIEKNFKMMFEKEINPNGHEIIEGVTFDQMIERIEKLFDILCIKEYHIMTEEKLKEYNDYVKTTIK
jgi:hypothetical protein